MEVREPLCGPEDFDQEQVETVREESVDADHDAEGEEDKSKDVWGGIHAAGASPSTGEPDGAEGNGQDLPSLVAGVENYQVDKLPLQK